MASRGIWSKVLTNFIASLRPRKINGNLMGQDYMNTKYYEIPADPQGGRRKSSRWFEPHNKENFQQEIPAEWEAWLRGRRTEPPTEEEVLKSLAISMMKKENAAKVALENPFVGEDGDTGDGIKSKAKFPVFKEYESPDYPNKH